MFLTKRKHLEVNFVPVVDQQPKNPSETTLRITMYAAAQFLYSREISTILVDKHEINLVKYVRDPARTRLHAYLVCSLVSCAYTKQIKLLMEITLLCRVNIPVCWLFPIGNPIKNYQKFNRSTANAKGLTLRPFSRLKWTHSQLRHH